MADNFRRYRQLPRQNVVHKRWSTGEVSYLQTSHPEVKPVAMAAHLNRTLSSVCGKLRRMGLS